MSLLSRINRTYVHLSYHRRARSASSWSRFAPVSSHDISNIEQQGLKQPFLLRKHYNRIPAVKKWFLTSSAGQVNDPPRLNSQYLAPFKDALVPLEVTNISTTSFQRMEAPFELLMDHISSSDAETSLYLAQHHLNDLPCGLQADLPTPELLAQIGRGDVYASSLWMGRAPTRTPLHRDPNPNLLVQLAGEKVVRLMEPRAGQQLFERLRAPGSHASMRGDDMMRGQEMERLEAAVWDDEVEDDEVLNGLEATLEAGDALMIPLHWWHAVHGTGMGVNASVNWWFR